ncbi:MAG: sugar kinase [Deltaproteobacteria bacterium]|nr:sugar kinase [Deltaproteobacteria bacterium]
MNKYAIDIFGLGQCSLDYIGKVGTYPPANVKCEFSDLVVQGGGPVATALVALSRWGLSCAFSGVIGNDLFGAMITESLVKESVDTMNVRIREDCDSQFAFIVSEPGRGRRTIFWRRPTGPALESEEVNYEMIKKARMVHTDGLFIEAALSACKCARKNGIPVSVDAGTLRDGMLDLARFSDFYIASETFASSMVGGNDPLEACYRLSELGPRLVGVTLGDKGSVALSDGEIIQQPAYPVDAIDTTGCGDVFHAGFIYGILKEWSSKKSLDFAAWAAAMVSCEMGGRTGIPSPRQVEGWKRKKS